MSELSENYFLHLGLNCFPCYYVHCSYEERAFVENLKSFKLLAPSFRTFFIFSSFPISMLICFKTTVQKELGKLRDALAISKIPTTHFFYKQQFYKQYQAKVGKKSIKSLATP